MRRAAVPLLRVLALAALLLGGALLPAAAQLSQFTGAGQPQGDKNAPVAFTADQVTYDRDTGLVTATGHVEAWQNGTVLRAERMTFDRNTNVLAAKDNVVLLQPDGQVVFADYAELTQDMKDGVLRGMRAILAQNGKLAANGARRTGGEINELSKVVYSTCNLCKQDPSKPPLWQIRALNATQDLEHKKIEYEDALLQIYGVPVAYFPYFWTADPSVKRESGLLIPTLGNSSTIGVFFAQPYYWVIDGQSDATITPMITSKAGPQLDVEYRRRFNSGALDLNVSAGQLDGSAQGTVFAKGRFNINDTWRWGFDLNRASSINYVNDFHLASVYGGVASVLSSQLYVEGFGEGSYARFDTRFYQGLTSTVIDSKLPVVLPRFEYSYFGRTDPLGGRLSVDTGSFNVVRDSGTNTRRADLELNWDRPFQGPVGDLWTLTLHNTAVAYNANDFNQQPNYGTQSNISDGRDLPQVALEGRWPLLRDGGAWGSQLIEPIVQVVGAPIVGNSQYNLYPNEDSLDLEFTDANLFNLNRFPGIDRLEGGSRVSAAMHGAWYLGGTTFDGLIGQSYQPAKDNNFSEASGLHDQVSDVVARASFSPTPWLDLTYRTRLDKTTLATRFADATTAVGTNAFRVTGGYIYTTVNPYTFYDQAPPPPAGSAYYFPRNEISLGADSRFGDYHFAANVRRDLQTNKLVSVGAQASYENECAIFTLLYYRQYTTDGTDLNGTSAVLFQITLKTIGQFGFHAL